MPSQSPYSPNPHGVDARPIDFGNQFSPTTKTWHGITIVVEGKVVGRITNWSRTAYTRTGAHLYELNHRTYGKPIDYVVGRTEGYQITAARTEVWEQELEITLGFPAVWNDLQDQDRPFTIDEYLFRGAQIYRIWRYTGCWFNSKEEGEFSVDGDAIVRVNATISYVNRVRTT